jgi:hypothetical protein
VSDADRALLCDQRRKHFNRRYEDVNAGSHLAAQDFGEYDAGRPIPTLTQETIMKRIAVTFELLAALAFAPARADTGFYFGGSIGNATFDGSAPQQNISFDDSDTGYKLYAGFRILSLLAIEGGYVDFGEQEASVAVNPPSVELSGWNLFGVANLPIGPVNLFGKVGYFAWDSEFSGGNIPDESDSDIAYGVGAAFRFGGFGVRGEYEIFEVSGDDVQMFSVGAEMYF